MRRGEAGDLELDDDEAGLHPFEEQQVDVEVVTVELEVVLPADEGDPWPSSSRKACSRLTSAVSRSRSATDPVRSRKSNTYGVAGQLLRQVTVRGRELVGEVRRGGPDPLVSRFMIWLSSTLRDQPCSAAAAAYQSRSAWASSLASRTVAWPREVGQQAVGQLRIGAMRRPSGACT